MRGRVSSSTGTNKNDYKDIFPTIDKDINELDELIKA
jgi:hypothetical protein